MADGSVVINIEADDKDAQKTLAQLRREIERTEKSLQTNTGKHDAISASLQNARAEAEETARKIEEIKAEMGKGDQQTQVNSSAEHVDATEFMEAYEKKEQLAKDLKEAEATYASQSKTVGRLEQQEANILGTIQQQNAALERQKSDAGEIERNLANQKGDAEETGRSLADQKGQVEGMSVAFEDVGKSLKKTLKNILKWGFGIRSTFILIRRLRSAIKQGVTEFAKTDPTTKKTLDALKLSLTTLKGAWGAAFAPIVNLVAPYLQKLIDWLVNAANAVQMFFAILNGKNTYKKVMANNNALAKNLGGVGAAADKAKKQLMSFDEINKLDDNDSGGGAGNALETTEQEIDNESLAARLALTVKDVLFNWDDLNPEQIAMKAMAGFTTLGGAIVGGLIGGVPGAIIGGLAGMALGILLDATTFNADGVLSESELGKALYAAAGLAVGGVLGFVFTGGSGLGVLLGASLGAVFTILLGKSVFDTEGSPNGKKFGAALVAASLVAGGAAIGFLATGSGIGALIGAVLGASLAVDLGALKFGKVGNIDVDSLFKQLKPILQASMVGLLTIGGLKGALIGASAYIALSALIKSFHFYKDDEKNAMTGATLLEELQEILSGAFGGLIGVRLATKAIKGLTVGGAMLAFDIGAAIAMTISSFAKLKGGQLSSSEFLQDLIDNFLPMIAGGALGFAIGSATGLPGGGLAGAAIGATIGMGVTLILKDIHISKRTKFQQLWMKTQLAIELEGLKQDFADIMAIDEDLTVKIKNITGTVDAATMVDLTLAAGLVQKIFDLDSVDNKTPEQIAELKAAIETLNGLGLDGIKTQFNETKGCVEGTREQLNGLINDMLNQYKLEALKDTLVESYKLQVQAQGNMEDATQKAGEVKRAYDQANAELEAAQAEYDKRKAEWESFKTTYGGHWLNGENGQDSAEYKAYKEAQDKLALAQTAAEQAKQANEDAQNNLKKTVTTFDESTAKVAEMEKAFSDFATNAGQSGEDAAEGAAEGLKKGSPAAAAEAKQAALDMLDSMTGPDALDEHSPSKAMEEIGENAMLGLESGITNNVSRPISAIQSLAQKLVEAVSQAVAEIKSIWQSDWGRPKVHIPVFELFGNVDFQTGRMPQIAITEWLWAARGGIINGATPIIAGEAGREAIVPLERNTEWITMVADGLIDRLVSANRMRDLISGVTLPALASGQVVPPRALSGGGSIFTDGDIERLVSGLTAAFSGGNGGAGNDSVIRLYLDGRQIAETVSKHQRQIDRERGR